MKKGFSLNITNEKVSVKSSIPNNYDDFYIQDPQFDFLFEGVLLNKKKLLNEFALKDFQTLIQELFQQKKEQIIQLFEIVEYQNTEENDSDIVYSFTCKDNEGINCTLSIITRKNQGNRKQLYINYGNRIIMYNIFNL